MCSKYRGKPIRDWNTDIKCEFEYNVSGPLHHITTTGYTCYFLNMEWCKLVSLKLKFWSLCCNMAEFYYTFVTVQFSSVQFSRSVVSDSLWPHESQHGRPPCPSPPPGVHSDSRPLSQWCHPAISSSVVPFSSCPQSLPASKYFPMSQLFAWGGRSPNS